MVFHDPLTDELAALDELVVGDGVLVPEDAQVLGDIRKGKPKGLCDGAYRLLDVLQKPHNAQSLLVDKDRTEIGVDFKQVRFLIIGLDLTRVMASSTNVNHFAYPVYCFFDAVPARGKRDFNCTIRAEPAAAAAASA